MPLFSQLQRSHVPGPPRTNFADTGADEPTPAPNPLSKPGTDLVINPTNEECEKGWRPGLKWTKEQFETFCTQMKTSK